MVLLLDVLKLSLRFVLCFIVQFIVETVAKKNVWNWWPVYGTIVDFVCLLIIRYEGKKSNMGLVGMIKNRFFVKKTVIRSILVGLVYIPIAVIGVVSAQIIIYGKESPPKYIGGLPGFAKLYSISVFPVIWGFTEDLFYLGCFLPRIRKSTNSFLSYLIVGFFWALQHMALPYIPDIQYLIFRFISHIPLCIIIFTLYSKLGSDISPLIVSHIFVNMFALITVSLQ